MRYDKKDLCLTGLKEKDRAKAEVLMQAVKLEANGGRLNFELNLCIIELEDWGDGVNVHIVTINTYDGKEISSKKIPLSDCSFDDEGKHPDEVIHGSL